MNITMSIASAFRLGYASSCLSFIHVNKPGLVDSFDMVTISNAQWAPVSQSITTIFAKATDDKKCVKLFHKHLP